MSDFFDECSRDRRVYAPSMSVHTFPGYLGPVLSAHRLDELEPLLTAVCSALEMGGYENRRIKLSSGWEVRLRRVSADGKWEAQLHQSDQTKEPAQGTVWEQKLREFLQMAARVLRERAALLEHWAVEKRA